MTENGHEMTSRTNGFSHSVSFISQMGLCYTDIAVVTAFSGSGPPPCALVGRDPTFWAFQHFKFCWSSYSSYLHFPLYFLNCPPLTNLTTATSYSIADKFHHERANSLAETLHGPEAWNVRPLV